MGELAEMMIGGEMCPCGEYMGDGAGFPQYCSKQCAKDYGGADERPQTVRASVQDIITGKWLDIALAVAGGAYSIPTVAHELHDDRHAMTHTKNVVATNVAKMLAAGLLHRGEGDVLKLTKRGKRQLANSRAPS